jgi:uncharacterized metal-binding protein YceD (DUF177 family)
VKFLRNYDIDIIKLRDGKHPFTFEVNNEFFKYYEAEDWVNGADITVNVIVNKTVSVLEVDFDINGTVGLTCDRSLEEFDHPLELTEKVIYKYGPVVEEISEDVFMITKDTPSINVGQLIYEFILLGIPAKKIHPDYWDETDEDEFDEEGSLIYLSEEEEENETEDSDEDSHQDKPADPRWEILNKLKKKD